MFAKLAERVMRTCSTCQERKPLEGYYDAYKYVKGWPVVVGKRKQCKSCCLEAKKNRRPQNRYIDDKPIGDKVVNDALKGWQR